MVPPLLALRDADDGPTLSGELKTRMVDRGAAVLAGLRLTGEEMKHRQTVEEYWGVWIWCNATTPERWEPFDEGIKTRKAAERELAGARETYPDDTFALVHTRNERVVERTKSEHGGKK